MGISRDSKHKRRHTGGKRKLHRKKRKYELGRPPAMTRLGAKRIHLVRCRGGNLKHRALKLDQGNFSWGSEAIARKTRILVVVYNASNNELVRTNTLVKNSIVQIDATPFRNWYEQHYGQVLGKVKSSTEQSKKNDKTDTKDSAKDGQKGKDSKAKDTKAKDAKPKEAAKPKDGAKPKEAAKPKDGAKPKEAAKPKDGAKPKDAKAKDGAQTKDTKKEGDNKQGKDAAAPAPGATGAGKSASVKAKLAKRLATHPPLDKHLSDQFNSGRLYACISSRPGQSGRCDGYILEGEELAFYLRKLK